MSNALRPALRAAKDLLQLCIVHPRWFVDESLGRMTDLRARGNARFRYGLREIHHHCLDPRFNRLAVDVGGAAWVDSAKAYIVARFCRLLQPARVLEIGSFRGGMTFHIARNTPDHCRIWTLDLPRNLLDDRMKGQMISSDVDLARMNASLVGEEWQSTPEAAKIVQLWGDSLHFDFTGLGPFDLIYVDGSHAEPWVARDTENAFALLAPTGAILWDDCFWHDVLSVLGRSGRHQPIYLFENGSTAGYLQIAGKAVSVS
jgi:predicted O-methyltransferase YrrM